MRIGFFPNMGKSNIIEVLQKAYRICKENNIDVYIPRCIERGEEVRRALGIDEEHILEKPNVFKDLDMAFSFGGDGTIIHLARQIYQYNVPICGINLGELGFLNQIELDQLESHIKRIKQGEYSIEQRGHLHAYINRNNGKEDLVPIINELVVTRFEPAKMARINLAINGEHTKMYPADGLIVASATGSTGYNLSAGGPIMAPDNRSIIVTPIAPHLLQSVSMVLKESEFIDITMPSREESLYICIDGTFDYTLMNHESLHIESNPVYCLFVRFDDQKFFSTLFKKLSARRDELL